jgi:hypothetical protein
MADTITNAPPARGPAPSPPPARQTSDHLPEAGDDYAHGGSARDDRLIRLTTTASVMLLAAIAAIVSYRHMHALVLQHGETAWTAALLPLSVDGMIAASSMALLADSRHGRRGGTLPWALLVVGSAASLAANVAVAEPTLAGRLIAAWPSFALIGSYELLMRQIRQSAQQPTGPAIAGTSADGAPAPATTAGAARVTTAADGLRLGDSRPSATSTRATTGDAGPPETSRTSALDDPNATADGTRPRQRRRTADLRLHAWQWALANRDSHGQLPTGKVIGARFGRKERWGRLVKKAGLAGSLGFPNERAEQTRAA